MKLLLQAAAAMGIASVASVFLKMLGAKVVASALGPSGVGIYAQIILISELGAVLSSMGLGTGIIRYASEFRSNENWARLRSLESTLILTLLPFSLLAGAGMGALSGELSRVLLGQPNHALAVVLVAASLPLGAVALIAETLTSAAKAFRYRATAIAVDAAAGLAFLAPLVIVLGVLGAAVSIVAAGAVRAIVAWFFALRLQPRNLVASPLSPMLFDLGLFSRVFQYGVATLASSSISYLSLLLVRTLIIVQLGTSANGLYQVVWASQSSWLGIMLSASGSYFYPSYCEAKDLPSRCQQINRIIRFVLLLTTPFLVIYLLFRSEVVLALYTPEFLPAVPLLGIGLLYGLLTVLAFCLTLPLLAAGKLRVIVGLALFQQSVFVAGSYSLLPVFELHGVLYSSAAANLLAVLISLVYSRQALGIRLSAPNTRTLVLSMSLVLATFGLSELPKAIGLPVSLVILAAWAHLVLDKSEMVAIRQLVYSHAKTLPITVRRFTQRFGQPPTA